MSEDATKPKVDPIAALSAALQEQTNHPVIPKVRVRKNGPVLELLLDGEWLPTTLEGVLKALQKRADAVYLMETDHFNHGYVAPAWDEILWEICKLRVRNPGIPIQPLVCGSNGSGKTFFCAWVSMLFIAGSSNQLMWSYARDENNSRVINQKWMYWYLPNEYKTDKGSVKRTAKVKLNYSEASGFTDNRFSLGTGTTCEYRFYKQEITTLEGPRPAFAWLDEEFEDPWLDGVERRLLTHAGRTVDMIPMWKKLLAEKAANPGMPFPREKVADLMVGVQLSSFTPKSGYTSTVRGFVKGAVTKQHVKAELLPVLDAAGEEIGLEEMPKLQYCTKPTRIVYYLHAWDNPIGGNWEGMKRIAKGKPKKLIKWWCYGVAEQTSGVMYPKFSRAAHCRPLWMLPREGTWYQVADPNDGTRNWTMSWTKVNSLNERFVTREWPQQDDFIPGEGYVGPWAEPSTGKRVDGDKGSAQNTFGRGYQFLAEEIRRVEQELYWIEQRLEEARQKGEDLSKVDLKPPTEFPEDAPRIQVMRRFMDSRAANKDTMTHGAAKTLVEVMREYKLRFLPVDKDHGALEGTGARVGHGAKHVENALDYDEKLTELNEQTGQMTFRGRAPKMYFHGYLTPTDGTTPKGCENHLFAMETWTNEDGGSGACKDFADLPRYLEMMDVRYVEPRGDGDDQGGWGGY